MHGVVLLDHFDASTAVLRDLVDVGSFHQAQTDIGVPQAVGGAAIAFAVKLEVKVGKNVVEHAALAFVREQLVSRTGRIAVPFPGFETAEGQDGTGHALAVAGAAFAADLYLKNGLAAVAVFHDFYVAKFKPVGLVGTQAGVTHEQHVVVHLLAFPIPTSAIVRRFFRALAGGEIEGSIFSGREPRAMRDLAVCSVWR